MFLDVISSGSEANGYVLQNEHEALIIECGCKLMEVKKVLGFNVLKVAGCIISHEHNDHSHYVKEYIETGFPTYSAQETYEAIKAKLAVSTLPIPPMKNVKIGNFIVTPFNVPHDTNIECYGYMIQHKEIGKLLFMTDLKYCLYSFKKLSVNHIIVEANYCMDYVDKELPNYEHILKGHMNIDTTCKMLEENKSSLLENVILCHLSNSNAVGEEFIKRAKNVVDCHVCVAKKGTKVNLDLVPFN